MSGLEKYFPTEMNLLRQVDNRFRRAQNEVKELNDIVKQLKNANIVLQQSEAKLNEKLSNYNHEIYKDVKIINDFYKLKNENEILNTEKESLKNRVHNLEQKIKQIEIENKRNIENIKNNFKIREKNLEEQIESLQASNTLDIYERENDLKKMKYDYEQKLENAIKREQNLKIELFDLKHQMTSSISVLNKKISDLQENNKRLENNQVSSRPSSSSSSNYMPRNTNFMSAKNILNISNSNSCGFQSNSVNYNKSTNQLNNNTQIQNTVNINNIEINPVKKFQFRKPQTSTKKMLLSEDFDPFKMHKETNPHLNLSNNSDDNIENSLIKETENIREHNQKYDDYNDDIDCYVVQSETSNTPTKLPKKRKLFDPNNFDYLEDN